MPELAGVTQADVLAVFDDVGDDQDFRMPCQQELLEHMDLQHAKTTAEIDLLLRGYALVAEHHHVMIQVRAVNAGKIVIIDRAGQVETDDLDAHRSAERADFKELWRDAWRS
ncbi:hypothetical protein D3C86_1358810 [compost metagenome]